MQSVIARSSLQSIQLSSPLKTTAGEDSSTKKLQIFMTSTHNGILLSN